MISNEARLEIAKCLALLCTGSLWSVPAQSQDRYATRLCEQYWGAPAIARKFHADCDCVGRYLEQKKVDPADIEIQLRLFASVYTATTNDEAQALQRKFGAETYQAALDRSRGFLTEMMARGGCRLDIR